MLPPIALCCPPHVLIPTIEDGGFARLLRLLVDFPHESLLLVAKGKVIIADVFADCYHRKSRILWVSPLWPLDTNARALLPHREL